MSRVELTPAAPDEWLLACRLALGTKFRDGRRAEHLLELVRTGDFDPCGLILARRVGVAVGAIAAQVLPGGTGVLLPPGGPDAEVRAALVRAALDHFARTDVAVAHCSLPEGDPATAEPLLVCGFRFVTRLLHMIRPGSIRPEVAVDTPAVDFVPYTPDLDAVFAETLLRTYTGSLDLPEATVDRPAVQLLDGHRSGRSHPPRWWLAVLPTGEVIGIAMLKSAEVDYLGIVPEFRRRDYGRRLLDFAIAATQRIGPLELKLTVDARNVPAIGLYRSRGFGASRTEDLYLIRLGTAS